jgi:hypothetical protein
MLSACVTICACERIAALRIRALQGSLPLCIADRPHPAVNSIPVADGLERKQTLITCRINVRQGFASPLGDIKPFRGCTRRDVSFLAQERGDVNVKRCMRIVRNSTKPVNTTFDKQCLLPLLG